MLNADLETTCGIEGAFADRSPRSAVQQGFRIGVIDSGVGGLTVLSPMLQSLPTAEFIYYADSAWCPYGPRGVDEVRGRVFTIVQGLVDAGCAMVVLACNTATAAAIAALRASFSIPFVGMEPAIKPAALKSVTRTIGVLATHGTILGNRFQQQLALYGQNVNIVRVEGEGLVEIVESEQCDTPMAWQRVRELVLPMVAQGIDHLVLGCTHYPFLMPAFLRALPPTVTIVNPALAVARQAMRVYMGLRVDGCERPLRGGRMLLISSGDCAGLSARLEEYSPGEMLTAILTDELAGVDPVALPSEVHAREVE